MNLPVSKEDSIFSWFSYWSWTENKTGRWHFIKSVFHIYNIVYIYLKSFFKKKKKKKNSLNIFNLFSHFTIVYIDDVLVYSSSIDKHWKHLHSFLDTIKRNGLVVSAKKVKLFQTKVRFLGFDISEGQIRPIDRAIQFVDKFPDIITEKTQLQRFLGSLNYVADFYKDMRKQCKPLFDRLKSNPPP